MGAKRIVLFCVGLVLVGLAVGLFFSGKNVFNSQEISQEKLAPDLSFTDNTGANIKLADFKGEPLVINSWASWCPFCVEELPAFVSLQGEFKDKITVVAVNRAEPPAIARDYTDERGLTEKLIFLLDPSDSFYQAIGGFSMPETIFVNKGGKIVFHKRGPMDLEEMRRRVQPLISN